MYGKTPKRIFMASTTMLLPYKNILKQKGSRTCTHSTTPLNLLYVILGFKPIRLFVNAHVMQSFPVVVHADYNVLYLAQVSGLIDTRNGSFGIGGAGTLLVNTY